MNRMATNRIERSPCSDAAPGNEGARPILQVVTLVCRWTMFALLAAQLLFAHGCHGDEDHELFGAIRGALEYVR